MADTQNNANNREAGNPRSHGNTDLGNAGDKIPAATMIRLTLSVLAVTSIVVFILQNLDSVHVTFLFWSFDAPLIVLLLAAAVTGVLLRWIISFLRGRHKK